MSRLHCTWRGAGAIYLHLHLPLTRKSLLTLRFRVKSLWYSELDPRHPQPDAWKDKQCMQDVQMRTISMKRLQTVCFRPCVHLLDQTAFTMSFNLAEYLSEQLDAKVMVTAEGKYYAIPTWTKPVLPEELARAMDEMESVCMRSGYLATMNVKLYNSFYSYEYCFDASFTPPAQDPVRFHKPWQAFRGRLFTSKSLRAEIAAIVYCQSVCTIDRYFVSGLRVAYSPPSELVDRMKPVLQDLLDHFSFYPPCEINDFQGGSKYVEAEHSFACEAKRQRV